MEMGTVAGDGDGGPTHFLVLQGELYHKSKLAHLPSLFSPHEPASS